MGRPKKERNKCLKCGKTVKGLKNTYCSYTCSAGARSTSYNVACKQCEKQFTTKPSSDGKFCSIQCFNDWQVGQERIERICKSCPYCGKEFFDTPSQLDKRIFCSCFWSRFGKRD